jgi:hypothetical protein
MPESPFDETPPKMLRQPADAPPPLTPLGQNEHLSSLHLGWARLYGQPEGDTSPRATWQRARGKARRSLPMAGADRELLGALIRAVDAIALRCDELADRLTTQEALTEDVTESFGADLTHLRADLIRVRSGLTALDSPAQ